MKSFKALLIKINDNNVHREINENNVYYILNKKNRITSLFSERQTTIIQVCNRILGTNNNLL